MKKGELLAGALGFCTSTSSRYFFPRHHATCNEDIEEFEL